MKLKNPIVSICLISSAFAAFSPSAVAEDARVWKRYIGELDDPSIPVLADYSYAGYRLGQSGIGETHEGKVFKVEDYGAIPNDGVGDQAAIQKAIDAAELQGGIVTFPRGEFLLNADPSERSPLTVRSSNVVLKGSGSGSDGTTLRMENYMLVPPGSANWHTPSMIEFGPVDVGGEKASPIVADASRGDFSVFVDNAELFVGERYIRLVMPSNVLANSRYLEGKATRASWTRINEEGVDLMEIHEVRSVDVESGRVELMAPLIDDLDASLGWQLETYAMLEHCGFEDLHFQAGFEDVFEHHKDFIHDYAWDAVSMSRVAHSWVRRSRFTNVTQAAGLSGSYASSVLMICVDGNAGHNSVGVGRSTRILQGLVWDNTNTGTWHGVDMSSRTAGSVVWRVDAPQSRGFDLHASFSRTNLIDRYVSFGLSGQGGGAGNIPHHLTGLVLWNLERTGEPIGVVDLWPDCEGLYCGLTVVNPTIVGIYGTVPPFVPTSVGYLESNRKEVYPKSLYEAQLKHRLGGRPGWLEIALDQYSQLRDDWAP